MKRAALYIRVSTLEQAQEGYSIGEQKERLIAYCKAQDWLIYDIYIDGGYSGANLNRPAIQKLISETDKFDVILVYKLDRLSRSQRDTLYLLEEKFLPANVDFVSMQESFDTSSPFGRAMIGLLAVFAQLEREQIKERTKMGRIARAKAGLRHGGGYAPIGYDYVDGKLVVNAYEAEQVRKIFEWFLAGSSLKSIAKRLREEHYTNRYSSYNSDSTIRNILENDVYIGNLKFGEIVVEKAHEAIIDEAQFKAAKALREKQKGSLKLTPFESRYLLTGMIFCGKCGARYYVRSSGDNYKRYTCYSRSKQTREMIKNPACKNRHWKISELEAIVESKIKKLLSSPENIFELVEACRPKIINQSTGVKKRIIHIDKQISKLMELYQSDSIPADLLGKNISKLYAEKTTLQSMLEPVSESQSLDLIQEILKNAAQIWDFADMQQKRRILQSLIRKITLTDDDVNIEWNF